MKCPKCGFEQSDNQENCLRCGVIFAKMHGLSSLPPMESAVESYGKLGKSSHRGLLKESFLHVPREENALMRSGRMVIWLGLTVWGVKFMFTPIHGEAFSESFMHLINLPFHEAGHVLLSPFGRFLQVLGGTLGQLSIPLAVAVSFALKGNYFAVSVGCWWLGQSFMDCAPYIDDARAGQLMLLGGVTGSEVDDYHDWEYILTRLGMMQYDHFIARFFFGCGLIITVAALLWGGYVLCCQGKRS